MLSAAPTIESTLLPFREWAEDRTNPLQRSIKGYLGKLYGVLESRKNLPKAVATLRDDQFALRIKALTWMVGQKLDFGQWTARKEEEMRARKADAGMEVLVWNMLFAVETGAEVIRGIRARGVELEAIESNQLEVMATIDFEQFETAITLGIPHPEVSQLLMTWLYASMDMEAGLLMGEAVLDGEVRIGRARIEDLNAFLVPATQTYGGCARLMRLVPVNETPLESLVQEPVPAAYVREQKELAELGIEDWFKQLGEW